MSPLLLLKKRLSLVLLCLFVVALVIRLIAIHAFPQVGSDASEYVHRATHIRMDGMYSANGSTPDDERAPVYPLFIALIQTVAGDSFVAIRTVQAFIDAFTCVIYCVIAFLLFKRYSLALWCGLLCAFHPGLVGSTTFILSETLTVFLLAITLLLMVIAYRKMGVGYYVWSAIALAVATLCRPVTLPYPLFLLGLVIVFHKKLRPRTIARTIIFLVCFIAAIAPWTLRNYYHFKTFIPVSANLGGNLFIASNHAWGGSYSDEILKIRRDIHASLPPEAIGHYHIDNVLKERAYAAISSDVLAYIRFSLLRIGRMWGSIPGSQEILKGRPLLYWATCLYHLVILFFALCGLTIMIQKKEGTPLTYLPLSFIVFFTLVHAALVGLPRYRIPIIPMLLIYSAYGLVFMIRGRVRNSE